MNNETKDLTGFLENINIPYRDNVEIKEKYEGIKANLIELLKKLQLKIDDNFIYKQLNEQIELIEEPLRIFIAGEFSKGKSYLINVLCGNETIRETNIGPQDTKITILKYGTSKENISTKYVDKKHYSFDFLKICNLVDSPGINAVLRPEHTKITKENISSANLIIFVTSAERVISQEEIELIKFISEHNKSEVIFVINKIDVFEDPLIDFIDSDGLKSVIRFLEQTIVKETNIRDPLIFPISTRRAMWSIINNNGDVWKRSGVYPLMEYINYIIQTGEAILLKLKSPINFINGEHIREMPILQGLLEIETEKSIKLNKSKVIVNKVKEDIKQQMLDIYDSINSFDTTEIEKSFEKSLDLFLEKFLSNDNLKVFKKMTKNEQEKYVQRELNDTFSEWEKAVDEKKLTYIDKILKNFHRCWIQCKEELKSDNSGYTNQLIEDRERREGKTLEESFDFDKQNSELIKKFENLKNDISSGKQKAFSQQVLNTHNAIESNSTFWRAVSATSLAGAFAGVIADLFITGGIVSLVSIIGGGGVAASALALRDQRMKKIKEQMQEGIDKTFEDFRTSFNSEIQSVFQTEANKFEERCNKIFVERLSNIVDQKISENRLEQKDLEQLLSSSSNIIDEIDNLSKLLLKSKNRQQP